MDQNTPLPIHKKIYIKYSNAYQSNQIKWARKCLNHLFSMYLKLKCELNKFFFRRRGSIPGFIEERHLRILKHGGCNKVWYVSTHTVSVSDLSIFEVGEVNDAIHLIHCKQQKYFWQKFVGDFYFLHHYEVLSCDRFTVAICWPKLLTFAIVPESMVILGTICDFSRTQNTLFTMNKKAKTSSEDILHACKWIYDVRESLNAN